jgi:hypothetical protein
VFDSARNCAQCLLWEKPEMKSLLICVAVLLVAASAGHAENGGGRIIQEAPPLFDPMKPFTRVERNDPMQKLWDCLLIYGSACLSRQGQAQRAQEAQAQRRDNCDPHALAVRIQNEFPYEDDTVKGMALRNMLELYGCIAPRPPSPQTTTTCYPFGDGFRCTAR